MNLVFIFSLSLVLLSLGLQLAAVGGKEDIKKCIDNERRALLDFKARLQDPSDLLSTWTAEEEHDCCKWSGVTCNYQTGHVTGLELPKSIEGSTLKGEVSPSLLNLTYLNHLDLSYNAFHGTIPQFIGFMTRLRYLDLDMNNFTVTIPRSIGSLTELRYLDLGGNNFKGNLPRSIGSLTKLRSLDISNNDLNGTLPLEFGNLTNLQRLSLSTIGNCTIENLDWLSHLSHLVHLNLDGISLAKANHWVNIIITLPKLSFLSLVDCDLSHVMYPYSSFFRNSSSSSSIDTLDLAFNNLNSSMFRWLLPLTSNRLELLVLSYNMLDVIPKYLGDLCGLKTFSIYGNSAVVKFPDFLKNLSGCTSLSLQFLQASHSQFTGSLSNDIRKFSSLVHLVLSDNQLNGTVSEKVWELPNLESLDVSSNFLRSAIFENIGKSKLSYIDLSNNSLEEIPSNGHVSNHSYVGYIDLSSCKFGPHFPKWILTLKNLTYLNIANNRISDTIPVAFWNTWPSRLRHLDLSSNNIKGQVTDLSSNFDIRHHSVIDLSSNNFHGPIPNVPSTLVSLNLSRNKFYGGISFLCEIVDGFLSFLDLSHNLLSGQLPDCLWHFKELKVLNLGHNNLSGRLPASIGYLVKLEVLYLYNNRFSGELPLSLKNCSKLNFLDLGANRFFGNVPIWVGENLSWLYILSLRSNNFFGTIPVQLCQLVNLQILDLSINNLNGSIPSCVSNLTTMVQEGFLPAQNVHHYSWSWDSMSNFNGRSNYYDDEYVDHAMIEWQGNEREFTINLGLLKSIDLSSNSLTGAIPHQVTNLYGLFALNLSNNALHGQIPRKIGELKELLTLDLSRNTFSGSIPSSMSQMTKLSYLDVSYNSLSGRIPSSTQLQSFAPSRYNRNAGLCGPPVSKNCPGDEEFKAPQVNGESEGGGEGIDELDRWFYIGGGIGLATGFWIACGTLLLNHNLKDWVYVKLMVFIAKLRRVAHT